MHLTELDGWSIATAADGRPVVSLMVAVDGDAELAAALAGDPASHSERFIGQWRAGERAGRPLISFMLVEEADPGLERAWWTHDFDRELLEAVNHVPHDVLVLAAPDQGVRVEVEYPSSRVAELLG